MAAVYRAAKTYWFKSAPGHEGIHGLHTGVFLDGKTQAFVGSACTLEILDESRQRGIPTIVLTDRVTAPSVPIADNALIVSSRRMTFTNASAAVHVLLNALVVEIAERHRGETVNAISRINEILRDKHYLVDDDS